VNQKTNVELRTSSGPKIGEIARKRASTTKVLAVWLFLARAPWVLAATHYVDLNSPNPTPPYTDWATAAAVIQDAVDAALAGEEVVVTNGVYGTGGRAVSGTMTTDRVVEDKPLMLRSVNGPGVTQIVGYQVPGTTYGPDAVRCVYLTSGASLLGFTLTSGATQTSGDSSTDLSGGGVWCEGLGAVVSNCVLTGNSAAYSGGGAYLGTLNNCVLTGNSAPFGGGGGASGGTLNNCAVTGNSAFSGGGASGGALNNCTITGNSVTGFERQGGGGAYGAALNNCIVYYNNAGSIGPNYDSCTLNYCCTTPLAAGPGNIDAEPQLASASHLSAGSRCWGRGSLAYASGLDLDGEPWGNPPSIGCDEYWSGSVTGVLSVAAVAAYTNVAVGFGVSFQALIDGRVSASRWDFGDASVVSNRPWATHAWVAAGDYVVELRAYNESYPAGVAATAAVRLTQEEHYVSINSSNPVAPYSSWATAATNIQDAVDPATLPGAVVWVADGVYQAGARGVYGMSNRVALTRPVTVRSVNGPGVTQIVGYQVPGTTNGAEAVRCAYLTNGAMLLGFTLTNGATQTSGDSSTDQSGGGVWCEGFGGSVTTTGWSIPAVVSNCVLTGNSAFRFGGGVFYGTLNNCTITGNSATSSYQSYGGGACYSTLDNCTVVGNTAFAGGGAYYGTFNNCTVTGNSARSYGGGTYEGILNNCIIYYNTVRNGGLGPNYFGGTLNNCCTTPLPGGPGNLTNEPLFVDTNGWTNLRLQSNSPCINAGNNVYARGSTDLDSRPRIVGSSVDIGAYEFPGPWMGEFIGWLQQHRLPTDGSADYADSDGDGMNNWQEWVAGTDPTNAASSLRLLAPVRTPPSVLLRWNSDTNHAYFIGRATSLKAPLAFSPLQTNIPGQAGTTSFTDAAPLASDAAFYRVGTGSTNGSVSLWLQPPAFVPATVTVTWTSVTNRSYVLQRSTNLFAPMSFVPVTTNIPGQVGTTSYSDTSAVGAGPFFYRVSVSN
jgi:hypothetical protein